MRSETRPLTKRLMVCLALSPPPPASVFDQHTSGNDPYDHPDVDGSSAALDLGVRALRARQSENRHRDRRSPAKRPAIVIFSQVGYIKQIHEPLRAKFRWLPAVLQAIGVAMAIFALARPQRADTKIKRSAEGIDIMIVWDISDSMLIEDMPPDENRMESAKHTIERFVKGRVSDRIGLIVFAGESYTRVPLTLDYPLLLKSADAVGTSHNMKMGTAIGVALANAVARLKDSTARSRVIIFLTDGENNTGSIDPETAIDIAKGYGIRTYSIGIGKDGEAQLPVILEAPWTANQTLPADS